MKKTGKKRKAVPVQARIFLFSVFFSQQSGCVDNSENLFFYNVYYILLFKGLMADKFGSYAASFYTSGALVIAGASIISLMTSVKQQPEHSAKTQSCDEELLVTERVTVL